MKISSTNTGLVTFAVESVNKGSWTWPSPEEYSDGMVPLLQNLNLPGGIPRTMRGDAVFINSAYTTAGSTITLATSRKVAGGNSIPIIATSAGKVYYWWNATSWVLLRQGLSTAAGIWWSDEQYGTDLYISNPTDGVYRFDASTYPRLLPIGAKHIATGAADEAAEWANETADTVEFKIGNQSVKVQSGNPGASAVLTYTPTADLNTTTGNLSGRSYYLTKLAGTDAYHFWMKFSNGSGSTITAATTTVVITDTAGKTLTWPATLWRATKDPLGAAISLVSDAWQEVWLFPSEATESATFNPAIVDTLGWKVTTSAGQTWMSITDVYNVYLTTMPAVKILKEWKNILFGFNTDTYYFSKVAAPDQYDILANSALKSGGEYIQGVGRFFNQLTIGTDFHIFTLSGSTQGSTYPAYLFDQNEVTDEIGMDSHRSVIKADNKLYWYWKNQIIIYDGTKADAISYPIQPTLNEIDESKAQFIVGAPLRKEQELWWTIRRTGQTVNDLIIKLNYKWKAFSIVEGISTPVIFRAIVSNADNLLTINETTRLVYVQNQPSSYTFHGSTPVVPILELPVMHIPGISLQWVANWVQYLDSASSLLAQVRYGDTLRELMNTAYTTFETVAMDVNGEHQKLRLGERAGYLQIRYTGDEDFTLQPPFIVIARQHPSDFVRDTP